MLEGPYRYLIGGALPATQATLRGVAVTLLETGGATGTVEATPEQNPKNRSDEGHQGNESYQNIDHHPTGLQNERFKVV